MTHRHRRLVVVSLPLIALAAAGLLAPLIAPGGPNATDLSSSLERPSWQHLLGTDQLGRDQVTRLLYAARTSMTVAAAVLAITVSIGVALGAAAGYVGGVAERITLRLIELALSVPTLIVALAVLGIRGNGVGNLVFALSVFGWAPYARLTRSVVASHRATPPIDAMRVLGARPARILGRHLLPVAVRPALVYASTDLGAIVLATATLSFLGLGIAPPTPEWGQMLVESRPFLASALWLALSPGIAVTALVVSSNLVSEHLASPPRPQSPRRRSPATATPAPERDRSPTTAAVLYEVADLAVSFPSPNGRSTVVADLSFRVERGRTVALVGESGSGKTVSVLGPFGLLPEGAAVTGSARLDGAELVGLDERRLRAVRAHQVGIVFQDPFASLNPLRTIGAQVDEAVRNAAGAVPSRAVVRRSTIDLLGLVGLPEPSRLAGRHPHELSGGMRQRVLIAAALAGAPDLLIADEPTSALDVTNQAELVRLLRRLVDESDLAMIVVSHDLAVVSEIADDVIVMYAGRAVEQADCDRVLATPAHPYSRGLIDAIPRPGAAPGTRFRTMPDARPTPSDATGCAFAPRCAWATARCGDAQPRLLPLPATPPHRAACHVLPFEHAELVEA